MARGQQLRAVSVIDVGDSVIRFEDLTDEQRQKFRENACKAIGEQLGKSLSMRPDEARKVIAAHRQ